MFTVRNQIPEDHNEIADLMPSDKSMKTEPLNPKIDFGPDVKHFNQVLNFERIQTYIQYAKT
jgi:hypothetical protein